VVIASHEFIGIGVLLLLVLAMLFAVITIMLAVVFLLYSYLCNVNVWLNPAIPVKPENEALEMNDSVVSIELLQSLRYVPHNLPYLDPTLPFVGRERDVRNVTDILVSNRVSIVGISGSPALAS